MVWTFFILWFRLFTGGGRLLEILFPENYFLTFTEVSTCHVKGQQTNKLYNGEKKRRQTYIYRFSHTLLMHVRVCWHNLIILCQYSIKFQSENNSVPSEPQENEMADDTEGVSN